MPFDEPWAVSPVKIFAAFHPEFCAHIPIAHVDHEKKRAKQTSNASLVRHNFQAKLLVTKNETCTISRIPAERLSSGCRLQTAKLRLVRSRTFTI